MNLGPHPSGTDSCFAVAPTSLEFQSTQRTSIQYIMQDKVWNGLLFVKVLLCEHKAFTSKILHFIIVLVLLRMNILWIFYAKFWFSSKHPCDFVSLPIKESVHSHWADSTPDSVTLMSIKNTHLHSSRIELGLRP